MEPHTTNMGHTGVSTQHTEVTDSVVDSNSHVVPSSQSIVEYQTADLSTSPSFTERYKIGFKYIPELYSGSTPFGKIVFVLKIIISIVQCLLGVVTILIAKDQNPDFRYMLFIIMYTIVQFLALSFLPYSFTKTQSTRNVPELVEVEAKRNAIISVVYGIQFLLLVTIYHPLCTVTPRPIILLYTTIVYLLLYIISLALPIFLVLVAIVFFPCTYLYFRQMVEAEEKTKVIGASDELISAFPTFGFRKKNTKKADIEMPVDSSSTNPMSTDQMGLNDDLIQHTNQNLPSISKMDDLSKNPKIEKKKRRFKLFSRCDKISKETFSTSNVNTKESTLELEDGDEATCTICLCEYEEGDRLRQLGCKHHFHKECIDEWLHLNSKCPLCKCMSI
ncbi:hypothetical protein BC833DRAFT_576274 [Globomyces pollinis-pini]|nr:hypothetical protein BC833DRAFT_576274 [Globomyces pollinis-pini]